MPFGAPITSRTNARVKALRASFSGKVSGPGELLGIEGEHLIAEAMSSGLELETVFVRQGSEAVLKRPSLEGTQSSEVVVLSADVFASAVDTTSPQGIAAMVKIPERRLHLKDGGTALVLEGLRDPGNLGTLVRSAEAFGTPFVLTFGECANPWNPKVVRASAGSVFRVPVVQFDLPDLRQFLNEQEFTLYAAVARGEKTQSALDIRFHKKSAIMIGNEGAGLSADALAMADALVTIPCETESLNAAVAGSLLLYEAMRQRAVHAVQE